MEISMSNFPKQLKTKFRTWITNVERKRRQGLGDSIQFPKGFMWEVYDQKSTTVLSYRMATPGQSLTANELRNHQRILEERFRSLT
jgi:hypothetical protein